MTRIVAMNAPISIQKSLSVFLLSLMFFSLASAQVFALDIQIRPDGSIYFYQSQVLGDEDEVEKEEKKVEKEVEKKEVEIKRTEEKREEKREVKRENQKPTKILPRNEQNRIRLTPQKNATDVQIEKKKLIEDKTGETPKLEFERKEAMSADDIRIGVPAVREKERETEVENEVENEQENDRPEIERLRAERRERGDEEFEIQSETKDDGTTEFQFESRNVKAKFPAAAEVLVDPTTREVTIMTPNGKEHVLQHLPDQAIDRMLEAGFATMGEDGTKSEVEVENTADDRVVFSMTQKKTKRLLGFPIEVENKVSLDDETGEVSETEIPPENPLLRVLNFFAR